MMNLERAFINIQSHRKDGPRRRQLAIHASCNPCHIARAELLRLLALAGFDHTTMAWREVLAGADNPVLVMQHAVLMMIE